MRRTAQWKALIAVLLAFSVWLFILAWSRASISLLLAVVLMEAFIVCMLSLKMLQRAQQALAGWNRRIDEALDPQGLQDALAKELRINKMAIYRKENIGEVAQMMIPSWEDRLHCVVSGDIWVDFLNQETNKGNAIRSIQKTLKISPDETMVFGDNHNDLEMIKSATESYAVGNAADAVKKAAKYVADTNVNDGVLKVLRTLL